LDNPSIINLPKTIHIPPNAWIDDLFILVEEHQAQKAIDLVSQFFNAYGMMINCSKSGVLFTDNCDKRPLIISQTVKGSNLSSNLPIKNNDEGLRIQIKSN